MHHVFWKVKSLGEQGSNSSWPNLKINSSGLNRPGLGVWTLSRGEPGIDGGLSGRIISRASTLIIESGVAGIGGEESRTPARGHDHTRETESGPPLLSPPPSSPHQITGAGWPSVLIDKTPDETRRAGRRGRFLPCWQGELPGSTQGGASLGHRTAQTWTRSPGPCRTEVAPPSLRPCEVLAPARTDSRGPLVPLSESHELIVKGSHY